MSLEDPKSKAESIKRDFMIQLKLKSEAEAILAARAYIYRLRSDLPTISGDYKMGYGHEWWQYSSYWSEVSKHI
jgi:hypothetical protein